MPTPTPITGLEDFVTAPTGVPVGDGEHFVMVVLHQPTPGSAELAHTVAYLVSYKTWQATEIGRSEPLGKDMGGFPLLIPGTASTRQTVLLIIGEATPGGAGSTGVGHAYTFVNAVPAALPATPGPRGPAGPPGPQGPAGVSGAEMTQGLARALVTAAGQFD
jgi:hypothetical protein